jgi:hypothetical protein
MDFETGLGRTIDWYRANSRVGRARAQRRVPHLLREELRQPRDRERVKLLHASGD